MTDEIFQLKDKIAQLNAENYKLRCLVEEQKKFVWDKMAIVKEEYMYQYYKLAMGLK